MQSLKFAHLVREHTEADGVRVLHRHPGAGKGVRRVLPARSRTRARSSSAGGSPRSTDALARCPRKREDGQLIVQVEDTLAGPAAPHPASTWSSCRPASSRSRTPRDVARRFGISCSSDGWVIERHPKLDPVATMTEGVFAAGCALGPRGHPGPVSPRRGRRGRAILGQIQQRQMAARADPGERRRGALLGLPHLQRAVPVQRHRVRRGRQGARDQPGALPGLRHLRRGLPRRRHRRHRLLDAQILAQIEGLLLVERSQPHRSRGRAAGGRCRHERSSAGVPAAARPPQSGAVRADDHRLHLQLVQLPRRRPRRARPGSSTRPTSGSSASCAPAASTRRSCSRPWRGRGRRHDHRLLAGRLPLPGPEPQALRRFVLLRRALVELGIEPERFKLVWASAAEGLRLAGEIAESSRRCGPSGRSGWGRRSRSRPTTTRSSPGAPRPRRRRTTRRRRPRRRRTWLGRRGGPPVTGNGKPTFAMYWAPARAAAATSRPQHPRDDPRGRGRVRRSSSGRRDGRQVPRRRGDGRRLDRP